MTLKLQFIIGPSRNLQLAPLEFPSPRQISRSPRIGSGFFQTVTMKGPRWIKKLPVNFDRPLLADATGRAPDYFKSAFTQPEWAAAFADDPSSEQGKLVAVRVICHPAPATVALADQFCRPHNYIANSVVGRQSPAIENPLAVTLVACCVEDSPANPFPNPPAMAP